MYASAGDRAEICKHVGCYFLLCRIIQPGLGNLLADLDLNK